MLALHFMRLVGMNFKTLQMDSYGIIVIESTVTTSVSAVNLPTTLRNMSLP
jgi:hypothetical protein